MKVFDPGALGLHIIKISGDEAKLRCPFHNDKSPSATFNLIKGQFHCFGCGYNANAYQLAREFGGDIVKVEFDLITESRDEREWGQLKYSPFAYKNKYLKSRKVTDEQVKRFGILECADGVLFSILDRDKKLVGLQLRKYEGDPKYVLNGDRTPVWPMSNLRYENLLLVEGVFGVLRADLYGHRAVCTMGASAIPDAARILIGHNVKVIFDDDFAGYLGAYSFMRIHKTSEVIVPGMEVDESSKRELEAAIQFRSRRNILQYAIETKSKRLVVAIKQKEKHHASTAYRKRSSLSTRKMGYR